VIATSAIITGMMINEGGDGNDGRYHLHGSVFASSDYRCRSTRDER